MGRQHALGAGETRKPRITEAYLERMMGLEPSAWQIARVESDWPKIRIVESLVRQIGKARSAYSGTKLGTKIVGYLWQRKLDSKRRKCGFVETDGLSVPRRRSASG